MGKHVTQYFDHVFDGMHDQLVSAGLRKPESDAAGDFYLFLLFVCLFLSAYPLICYFTLANNPHIVFWLGMEPQYVCLIVPALMVVVVVAMPLLKLAQVSQKSARLLVLLLFLAAGAAMIASAVHLEGSATGVAHSLVYHCGESGTISYRVESEWKRLDEFRRSCAAALATSKIDEVHVENCPGFNNILSTPHATFAGYIWSLELDLSCAGFCNSLAAPLFAARGSETSERCANAVGGQVAKAGNVVGLPVGMAGVAVILLGGALASYDHL